MEILWIVVLLGYALSVAQAIFALTTKRPALERAALGVLAVSFGAHTAWLLLRGIETGRCPITGRQEMWAVLSWCLVITYLVASRWYRAYALKAFILPIVLVLSTIAAISPEGQTFIPVANKPLENALLTVHVGLILVSYAAFFVAFGAGLMYIIQERELKNKRLRTFLFKMPSLGTCDSISTHSMAIGFGLLTLGILGGLWYSHMRTGIYWQNGPLELFSVVTWVVYLFLMQTRINGGWSGRTSALASIVSFLIVICSLVGVRFIGHA